MPTQYRGRIILVYLEFYVFHGGRHSPLAVIEICKRRVLYFIVNLLIGNKNGGVRTWSHTCKCI